MYLWASRFWALLSGKKEAIRPTVLPSTMGGGTVFVALATELQ
jgi:hypothetical protein